MSETPHSSCTDDPTRDDTLRDIMTLGCYGRLRWMVGVCWVYVLGFFVVAVLAAMRFFQVDNTRHQIMYATIFLTALLFVVITKMWYWMLVSRNSVKRDIRRLSEKIDQLQAK